jgi:hypothetical protein
LLWIYPHTVGAGIDLYSFAEGGIAYHAITVLIEKAFAHEIEEQESEVIVELVDDISELLE